MEDEKIIELFFKRSEQAIQELDEDVYKRQPLNTMCSIKCEAPVSAAVS